MAAEVPGRIQEGILNFEAKMNQAETGANIHELGVIQ
jgi:hypothetical protein